MNISNISFCGTTNNNGRRTTASSRTSAAHNGGYAQNASIQRNNLRKSSGLDSYEANSGRNIQQHKKKKPINPYKLGLLGLAALKLFSIMHSCANEPDATTIAFANAGEDVGIYAEMYGSSEEAIIAYNKLQSDIVPYDMEISIPAMYEHPVVDEIEQVQNELFTKKLDADERTEKQAEVAELLEIQQMQSEIATSYTDGDFVYYTITLPTDESATSTQAGYNGRINVEEFKDIFGIKDGVIRDHNNLGYTWGSNEYESWKDYTGESFYNGQTVKVPVNAISMKYIEFGEE